MSCTSIARCTAAWLPSTSTGMPRACASFTTSLTGTMVPSAFVIDRRPFDHGAMALAQEVPGHDVGVMLHDGDHDLVAGLDVGLAPGRRHEVDRLGGVAGEDDLFGACGV